MLAVPQPNVIAGRYDDLLMRYSVMRYDAIAGRYDDLLIRYSVMRCDGISGMVRRLDDAMRRNGRDGGFGIFGYNGDLMYGEDGGLGT